MMTDNSKQSLSKFRVFPTWSLIYIFGMSYQFGILDALVVLCHDPIFKIWPIVIIFLFWIVPLYLYFGIQLVLSSEGIRKNYKFLPFFDVFIPLSAINSVEKNSANNKNSFYSINYQKNGKDKILKVMPSNMRLISTDLDGFEYASFQQVLKFYKSNTVIKAASTWPKNNEFQASGGKLGAVMALCFILFISVSLGAGNELVQMQFSNGWSFTGVVFVAASLLIYFIFNIDKRPLDNVIYSALLGASLAFMANISLHLYTKYYVEPVKVRYKLITASYDQLVWTDEKGVAPEIIRSVYLEKKKEVNKQKPPTIDIDIYYGPFGLIMRDSKESYLLESY